MEQAAIGKTLAYFSLFQFPLTAPEIFSNLWQGTSQSFFDFVQQLEKMVSAGMLQKKYSYYFLPGELKSVEERRRSVLYVEAKLRRAYFAARLIANVSFLKAIFVCNSVAAESADADSDIDFFIIAETGRAWWVRLWTNVILFIFGLRRHGSKIANRICLSFYIDKAHANFTPLLIASDDVYMVYWLKQLVPLYDPNHLYRQLLTANMWQQQWVRTEAQLPFPAVVLPTVAQWFKQSTEWLLNGSFGQTIEAVVRTMQQKKIARTSAGKLRAVASAVVATEGVLKFHETDARQQLREQWINLYKQWHVTT